jgi:hypothetical protein
MTPSSSIFKSREFVKFFQVVCALSHKAKELPLGIRDKKKNFLKLEIDCYRIPLCKIPSKFRAKAFSSKRKIRALPRGKHPLFIWQWVFLMKKRTCLQ